MVRWDIPALFDKCVDVFRKCWDAMGGVGWGGVERGCTRGVKQQFQ